MTFGNQRKIAVFLALTMIAGLLLLAGCTETKVNKDNFDKIKLGMSQEEVQRLLGPPTEATGLEVAVFSGSHAKWVRGDTTINIQFINGKVVAKEFSKQAQK